MFMLKKNDIYSLVEALHIPEVNVECLNRQKIDSTGLSHFAYPYGLSNISNLEGL